MALDCPQDDACSSVVEGRPGPAPAASRPVRAPGSTPGIPVRRFGTLPIPEEDLAYEVQDDASARTIAEYGAAAVWMAALSAAFVAGLAIYLN